LTTTKLLQPFYGPLDFVQHYPGDENGLKWYMVFRNWWLKFVTPVTCWFSFLAWGFLFYYFVVVVALKRTVFGDRSMRQSDICTVGISYDSNIFVDNQKNILVD